MYSLLEHIELHPNSLFLTIFAQLLKNAGGNAPPRAGAERKKVTMQASAETFGGTKVSNRPDRQTDTVLITDDLADVRKE
jgi:hypothetical protein